MRAARMLPLLLLVACEREVPRRVESANLGYAATFPGDPKLTKHLEESPFGPIEWFDTAYNPPGRLDETFRVEVGNLPPGRQGGATPTEVAETFRKDLERRFGGLEVKPLAPEAGPGFRYRGRGPNDAFLGGVLVVRRGRLHHAQVTARAAEDPRVAAFLDGFQVTK